MTACLVVWHYSENQQLSVPSLWRHVFTEMTCPLLCQSHQLYYWFRASSAAGMKDYAGFTDRFEFIFSLLCQVFLLRTESGPGPAAGRALSLFLSLPFRQSQCHSLLSQRIATSVLALCVHSSICTETQHAVQSLCLQCAIDKMSASEWNCREHPLCVSLL